jgi:hypothetical protein
VAQADVAVAPYVAERVTRDLLAHDRRRVERLVAAGLARYRSMDRGSWSYTVRGGLRSILGTRMLGDVIDAHRFEQEAGRIAGGFAVGQAPKPDRLATLSRDPSRCEEFVRVLAEQGVWVVARPLGGSGGADEFNVEYVRYDEAGVSYFPLFSSGDEAARFIESPAYGTTQGMKQGTGYAAYQAYQVEASWLSDSDLSGMRLMLNPGTASQTELTASDLEALRAVVRERGAGGDAGGAME